MSTSELDEYDTLSEFDTFSDITMFHSSDLYDLLGSMSAGGPALTSGSQEVSGLDGLKEADNMVTIEPDYSLPFNPNTVSAVPGLIDSRIYPQEFYDYQASQVVDWNMTELSSQEVHQIPILHQNHTLFSTDANIRAAGNLYDVTCTQALGLEPKSAALDTHALGLEPMRAALDTHALELESMRATLYTHSLGLEPRRSARDTDTDEMQYESFVDQQCSMLESPFRTSSSSSQHSPTFARSRNTSTASSLSDCCKEQEQGVFDCYPTYYELPRRQIPHSAQHVVSVSSANEENGHQGSADMFKIQSISYPSLSTENKDMNKPGYGGHCFQRTSPMHNQSNLTKQHVLSTEDGFVTFLDGSSSSVSPSGLSHLGSGTSQANRNIIDIKKDFDKEFTAASMERETASQAFNAKVTADLL